MQNETLFLVYVHALFECLHTREYCIDLPQHDDNDSSGTQKYKKKFAVLLLHGSVIWNSRGLAIMHEKTEKNVLVKLHYMYQEYIFILKNKCLYRYRSNMIFRARINMRICERAATIQRFRIQFLKLQKWECMHASLCRKSILG